MQIVRPGITHKSINTDSPSIVTIGNFDGVHRGHQHLIAAMIKAQAQYRNCATTLFTFKHHPISFFRPDSFQGAITDIRERVYWLRHYGIERLALMNFNQRTAALSAEEFVEWVLISQLNTQHLFIGRDFVFGKNREGNYDLLKSYSDNGAFMLHALDDILENGDRISSTLMRSAIKEGDLEKARLLAGHKLNIIGTVRYGKQLGRTIGFPTANIALGSCNRAYAGVYAVRVQSAEGWQSDGVANIGVRPTVDSSNQQFLEVHLFDFNKDCYGECLDVELVSFIRAEQRFDGVEMLKAKIVDDVELAKAHLSSN